MKLLDVCKEKKIDIDSIIDEGISDAKEKIEYDGIECSPSNDIINGDNHKTNKLIHEYKEKLENNKLTENDYKTLDRYKDLQLIKKIHDGVNVDYRLALNHLNHYLFSKKMSDDTKDHITIYIRNAIKNASLKIVNYKSKYRVNMEEPELLRDVVFIGASLIEINNIDRIRCYKNVVLACISLVEIRTNKRFNKDFVIKMLKAKASFECYEGTHFQAEAFYFVFKTHFRLS